MANANHIYTEDDIYYGNKIVGEADLRCSRKYYEFIKSDLLLKKKVEEFNDAVKNNLDITDDLEIDINLLRNANEKCYREWDILEKERQNLRLMYTTEYNLYISQMANNVKKDIEFYKAMYDSENSECSFCHKRLRECGEDHGDEMREIQRRTSRNY